jgi:hypothetical protein
MHHIAPQNMQKRCVGTNLLLLLDLGGLLGASLLLALPFLQESLWDENLVLGRDGTARISD